jgi:hypothetical protein
VNGIPWKPYTYRGTGSDTLTAWMDELPAPRQSVGRILQPCGTAAAAQRHYRRGEQACPACLEAMRRVYEVTAGGREGRQNVGRREKYRRARDAGLSVAEAQRVAGRAA